MMKGHSTKQGLVDSRTRGLGNQNSTQINSDASKLVTVYWFYHFNV